MCWLVCGVGCVFFGDTLKDIYCLGIVSPFQEKEVSPEEWVTATIHGTLTKLIIKYVGDNTTCIIVINLNIVKI